MFCQRLTLKSFVHTETQDGKSSIDAHFAVCMRHVLQYVDTGNNVISPLQLYQALNTNGGVTNTVTSMYDLDRNALEFSATKSDGSFFDLDLQLTWTWFAVIRNIGTLINMVNLVVLFAQRHNNILHSVLKKVGIVRLGD